MGQQLLIPFRANEATLSSATLRRMIQGEFTRGAKPISRSWLLDGDGPKAYPRPAA